MTTDTLGHDALMWRRLQSVDEGFYVELYTDRQTMRQIGPAMDQRTAADSFACALALSAPARVRRLVLCEISGQAIALAGIEPVSGEPGWSEFGIFLRATARGRHLSRAGLGALIAASFVCQGQVGALARIAPENTAAVRLHASLTFVTAPSQTSNALQVLRLTKARWQQSAHTPRGPINVADDCFA